MKSRIHRMGLFWGLCFILSLGLMPAYAQGANLLTNPGFEQPFITLDGTPPRQVAQGWSPWNLGGGQSASENVQPEYYPASDVTNGLGVPRIRSGSDAQQYHSFFATAQLRFSAYVYVWSSTFDEANKSDGDGGVVVTVGIDPTGGTSADSTNVVWSASAIQYDAYNEYTVSTTASESSVTVFVRTTVSVPVKNTNIYVDDASLVVAGTNPPPATSTPIATATQNSPPSATNTLVPTATQVIPVATSTSDDLGIVSTATPAPSSTPLPTSTSLPLATAIPTNTPIPQPTNTVIPTEVPPTQEAQVSTNTPISATATLVPTSTATPFGGVFFGKVVHVVRSGDTVGQLASIYGSTTSAIVEANGLNDSAFIRVGQTLVVPVRLGAPATSTPTVTPLVPPTTAPPVTTTYVVVTGDTLGRIAVRFNTTASTLAQLNGITNPNIIHVGQRLIIPVGGQVITQPPSGPVVIATSAPPSQTKTYVVRAGDTLFRIALRNGVSLRSLIQANGIVDANRVYVGQVLVIP